MVKFNFELKLKVVLEYIKKGYGSTYLKNKYGIAQSRTVLLWVNMYKAYGSNGLIVKTNKTAYSGDYKIKVLNWMVTYHKSYPKTALHFNIPASSTIFTWQRRMETKGILGLYTSIGSRHKMKTENISNEYLIKYNFLKIKMENNDKTKFQCIRKLVHYLQKSANYSKQLILNTIKVPVSTYDYHAKHDKNLNKDKSIKTKIKKIVTKFPYYGYRRVTKTLNNNGVKINHKKVQRIMKENNWQCQLYSKQKRKYNSYKGAVGKIAANIIKGDFSSKCFGCKLTTDVSEFRYGNQDTNHRVYLSPIMDLYSDKIIAYNISDHPTVKFTLKPLRAALKQLQPLNIKTIIHSDQGFQYQSSVWVNTLKEYNAIQSMSRKGTCLDNAQMEAFFHIMKAEVMYKTFKTKEALISAMKAWIKIYNNDRIKEKLGYQSPNQYLGLIS